MTHRAAAVIADVSRILRIRIFMSSSLMDPDPRPRGYPAADRKRRPRSRFGASMAGAVPANRPGSAAGDAGGDVVGVDADVDAVGTEVPGDRLSRRERAGEDGPARPPER